MTLVHFVQPSIWNTDKIVGDSWQWSLITETSTHQNHYHENYFPNNIYIYIYINSPPGDLVTHLDLYVHISSKHSVIINYIFRCKCTYLIVYDMSRNQLSPRIHITLSVTTCKLLLQISPDHAAAVIFTLCTELCRGSGDITCRV